MKQENWTYNEIAAAIGLGSDATRKIKGDRNAPLSIEQTVDFLQRRTRAGGATPLIVRQRAAEMLEHMGYGRTEGQPGDAGIASELLSDQFRSNSGTNSEAIPEQFRSNSEAIPEKPELVEKTGIAFLETNSNSGVAELLSELKFVRTELLREKALSKAKEAQARANAERAEERAEELVAKIDAMNAKPMAKLGRLFSEVNIICGMAMVGFLGSGAALMGWLGLFIAIVAALFYLHTLRNLRGAAGFGAQFWGFSVCVFIDATAGACHYINLCRYMSGRAMPSGWTVEGVAAYAAGFAVIITISALLVSWRSRE